jgi:CheY-like chemotaxis protein
MATLGSLELLRRRLPQDKNLLRHLDNAVQAAQRGADLTQRMLAFARRQDLKPTAVDVPDLVRGMADLLQRSIGPSVRVETRFPLGLPRALVDPHQLELALLNLAVNARDAMSEGGTITIAARQAKGNDIDGATLPGKAEYVCLQVRDSGQGMDEPTLARAKEPFFTTKGVGKGTGLGLSMVHGLAEQSGGRLILKSEPGAGTIAQIWLPVAGAEEPPEQVEAREDAAAEAIGPLTVLVVEDDPIVLQTTAAMLEDRGHRTIQAASGESALAILHRERNIDLVLTDHVMPGMTGLQLVRAIRTKWPELRFILATGYAELQSHFDPDIPRLNKPFTEERLLIAIRDVMVSAEAARKVVQFRSRHG